MVETDEPWFEVDSMLVKLARYLRILGYDAAYDLSLPLAERILRADVESRVFLTRNRKLARQPGRPEQMLLLRDEDPVRQLWQVVAECDLDPEAHLFSRCIRCNVELETVEDKAVIAAEVPARTFETYARFYTCPNCHTVLWKGTHVRNTCRKFGLPDASELARLDARRERMR